MSQDYRINKIKTLLDEAESLFIAMPDKLTSTERTMLTAIASYLNSETASGIGLRIVLLDPGGSH